MTIANPLGSNRPSPKPSPSPQQMLAQTTKTALPPPFVPGQVLTAQDLNDAFAAQSGGGKAPLQSELRFGGSPDSFIRFLTPPPNAVRRFLWRWVLGATWVDLRPERRIEELGRLK